MSQPAPATADRQRQVREIVAVALRRWASAGFDAERGVFIEALDFQGDPLPDLPRRGRVQARQVYAYALAHRYGMDPGGDYLRLAQRASERSEAIYAHPEGGWQFLASAAGEVLSADRFAYEQSFRIMSLSALYRVTEDGGYAGQAEAAWDWLGGLDHPEHGGYHLSLPLPPAGTPREQNPHMHLLEACLEAQPIDPPVWLARAGELYRLAEQRFVRADGALVEFFADDWTPTPDKGDDVQPGHHFEWVWLLTQYGKLTGTFSPAIELLYRTGSEWGLDGDGLGFDEVRAGGGVLRATKRLWVQCEVLKGHLARYETTREPLYLERADQLLDRTIAAYLLVDKGVWYDQIDERGRNISPNAPASTFYHLLVALHEYLRVSALPG